MGLENITFGELVGAGVVLMILIGIYNTAMTAIKNYLEAKRRNSAPVDELKERVDSHDKMLERDKRRLDGIDERLVGLKKESSMTLHGVRALLSHEINGNSTEKLTKANSEIDEYLEKKN